MVTLFVLLIPVIVPEVKVLFAIEILIFALLAISYNLVFGGIGSVCLSDGLPLWVWGPISRP